MLALARKLWHDLQALQLADAVKIWKNYLDNKTEIDVVFETYGDYCHQSQQFSFRLFLSSVLIRLNHFLADTNRSGKLERDQLKR